MEKQRRGFAGMSAEKRREIASKGGRTAHAKGTGHEWTQEEAVRAGRLGGLATAGRAKARRESATEVGSAVHV